MRMESLAESAISTREFSVRFTCSTMFDCPEHSHTSPTSTSATASLACAVTTRSVYGPPAGCAGSRADQRPSRPARTLIAAGSAAAAAAALSETVTSSPAAAQPHTGIG